jgi:hypothetical protein
VNLVRIGLSPRVNGLTRPAAQKHWAGVHAPLFAQMPYVESYVQNQLVLDDRDEPLLGDPGFDIFSEVEFRSCAAIEAAMASSWYRNKVIPDERRLLDASRRCFLMTHRYGACRGNDDADHFRLVEFLTCPGGHGRNACVDVLFDNDAVFASGLWDKARASVYVVMCTGGAAVGDVDLLMAQSFVSAARAREAHDGLLLALSGSAGPRSNLAVIVKENRVRLGAKDVSGEIHGES